MSRGADSPRARQLSLFDASQANADEPAWPPGGGAARSGPGARPRPTPQAGAAPSAAASQPIFRHPQADREIHLDNQPVAYLLRRARRRSIGFCIGDEGLSVSAPRWLAVHDIEAALHEKARWILRKLREQHDRAQRLRAARVRWHDGTSLPFLGESVIVVLDPQVAGAVLDNGADTLPGVPRLTLHVGLTHTAAPQQIRDVVQSWLQRQARRIFDERCRHFAPRLGVRMTRLSLSSAQTRWGSASADGSIRLNWRLVHFSLPTIDYVVAHELAHLREMNHSPRFWDVVRSVLPDYETSRGRLKDSAVPMLD